MQELKKKHDKIVLLWKDKLNNVEVLILKPYIIHDQFLSVNNVLREYNEMEEEINILCYILCKNNGNAFFQL